MFSNCELTTWIYKCITNRVINVRRIKLFALISLNLKCLNIKYQTVKFETHAPHQQPNAGHWFYWRAWSGCGYRPQGPRESLVEPRLEAEKGAQYNLRELQALLHEADMTATATTIRYVYSSSFRKNVSYLQFVCVCIKHGALSVDYVIRFRELTIKCIDVGLVFLN